MYTDIEEDEIHFTFGKKIGKSYKPASDFLFHFVSKVTSSKGAGYIINIYPERKGDEEIIPK